jgi:PAS domain S-box-containing protein
MKPPYHSRLENRNVTAHGIRWFRWENSTILDSNGKPNEFQAVGWDITEQKKAQQALIQSEERYRLIADNMTDVVFLMGLDLKFLYFSPSVRGTSGYTAEEMRSKQLDEIMTTDSFEKVTGIFGEMMTPENLADPLLPLSVKVELQLIKKEGSPYWADVTGSLIRDEKGTPIMILGVAKDINEQKIAQLGLQRRDEILEAVNFTATRLLESADWKKQAPNILEKLGTSAGVDRVYLLKYPENNGHIDVGEVIANLIEWAAPGVEHKLQDSQPPDLIEFSKAMEHWKKTLTKGEVIVGTPEHLPKEEKALIQALGLRGIALVPILLEGHLWGLLGFDQIKADRTWDSTELEALKTFADTFASAIQRNKAFSDLLDRETRLHAILEASKDAILVALKEMTVYANTSFRHLFGLSQQDDLEDISIDSLIAPGDRERYRTISQDRQNGKPAPTHYELKALKKNGGEFDLEVYVSTYDLMGETYTLALLRDITEKKQHDREIEVVAQLSTTLRKARTREEMCLIIVDQLGKVMQADGALIMLEEHSHGDMVVQFSSGEFAGQEGFHIPAGQGISGKVKKTKKPYVSHDLLKEPLFYRGPVLNHCKEAVFYPMIVQKTVIGTLLVSREHPFDKTEIKVIGSIAEMAANAIIRSALHEQTENQLQKMIALRQIDKAISSTLDLHEIIDTILTSSQKFLNVDAADILLYEDKSKQLKYAYGIGFRTNLMEEFTVNIGKGWAGTAARSRKPLFIPDINQASALAVHLAPPAEELVSCYAVPMITNNQIKGVMECFTRSALNLNQDWIEFVNLLAGQAAIAINSAQLFDEIKHSNDQLVHAYDETIEGWSRAMDIRDKETEGHTKRVVELTLRLARAMGIPEVQLTNIKRGTLLHDIGKLVVPDSILFKPSSLNDLEWKIMKKHPLNAYNMLSSVDYLKPALDIPYCHHEHWDGSGYPRGLKGEEIPLAARIFSVVDIWDALLSDRPYRPAWTREKTLAYIKDRSGEDLDPKVVNVFLKIISEPK